MWWYYLWQCFNITVWLTAFIPCQTNKQKKMYTEKIKISHQMPPSQLPNTHMPQLY